MSVQPGYTRAMAWARHSGGLGVTLTAGGEGKAFQLVSAGSAKTLDGVPCTESAFSLTGLSSAGGGAVSLTFALDTTGGNGVLYDYGVIFI